jgi:hypothetical protein
VTPTAAEAVEIHNPTTATITLTDYWLYNATYAPDSGTSCHYYDHTTNPSCGSAFGDFDLRFPTGTTIGPGETIVIAVTGAVNYMAQCEDGGCGVTRPDFEVPLGTAGDPSVPDMLGKYDTAATAFLTNGSEDLVLYTWNGDPGGAVKDIDYFIWGDSLLVRTDKTGVGTFLPDTPIDQQSAMKTAATATTSFQRLCYNEAAEKEIGGNGVSGHDETSEDLNSTFISAPPSMGQKTPGAQP